MTEEGKSEKNIWSNLEMLKSVGSKLGTEGCVAADKVVKALEKLALERKQMLTERLGASGAAAMAKWEPDLLACFWAQLQSNGQSYFKLGGSELDKGEFWLWVDPKNAQRKARLFRRDKGKQVTFEMDLLRKENQDIYVLTIAGDTNKGRIGNFVFSKGVLVEINYGMETGQASITQVQNDCIALEKKGVLQVGDILDPGLAIQGISELPVLTLSGALDVIEAARERPAI